MVPVPYVVMNSKLKSRKTPWTNLAVFENESDAHTLETFLQFHRIEARTVDNHLAQLALFLCPPASTSTLQIREIDLARALDFLTAGSSTRQTLNRAIHCPACGSFKILYPSLTRSAVVPTMALHLNLIFRFSGHEAFCENCRLIWQFHHPEISHVEKPLAFNQKR